MLTAAVLWLVGGLVTALPAQDSIVLAAVIAVGGAVVTAITALFVKKVEKKHEVEAQFRQDKVDLFSDLLTRFDQLSSGSNTVGEELMDFLKDFQRKIVFWAGPRVMMKYFALRKGLTTEIRTIGDLDRSSQLMGALILAMRKDVGLSNFGLDPRTFAAELILRHADLFLNRLKDNPNMTTAEFAKIEKVLDKGLTESE